MTRGFDFARRGKKCDYYLGADPFSGSLKLSVPELFVAEMSYSAQGVPLIQIRTEQKELQTIESLMIQNGIVYRSLLKQGVLAHGFIPESVRNSFSRAVIQGDIAKAMDVAYGFSQGFFLSLLEWLKDDLKFDRYLGREGLENSDVFGFVHERGSEKIYVVPGVFIAVDDGEQQQVNFNPAYLRNTRELFLEISQKENVQVFPTKKRTIDDFTKACCSNKKSRIGKVLRRIMAEADSYLENIVDENDENNDREGKTMIED
jgi:hypothetical protein